MDLNQTAIGNAGLNVFCNEDVCGLKAAVYQSKLRWSLAWVMAERKKIAHSVKILHPDCSFEELQ